MKILITGYKGYIGSYFFNKLKKYKRVKIEGVSSKNKNNKYLSLIKKKFYPSIILHCAGSGLVGSKLINQKIHKKKNLTSTIELINFIEKSKIKNSKIIFLSSQAVYGKVRSNKISEMNYAKPISNYGKTKLQAEKKLLKLKENSIVILRLFSIYGLGLKKQIIWDACDKFNKKNFSFRGTGLEKRDFLNIRDLNNLIKKIIYSRFSGKEIFNVGTGKGISIRKLLNDIKIEFKILNKIYFVNHANNVESFNYICANKKIKKFFKWKPKSIFKIELKRYVRWFKNLDFN